VAEQQQTGAGAGQENGHQQITAPATVRDATFGVMRRLGMTTIFEGTSEIQRLAVGTRGRRSQRLSSARGAR
jgi:hypothetical protein